MKIRKNVVAWMGMILCLLAVGFIFATPTSNLFAVIPGALFIPFLVTLCKADTKSEKKSEEESEEKPKRKINWPKVIAWILVWQFVVDIILFAIFLGWWCLLPLIALMVVFIWLAHLYSWPKFLGKLFIVVIAIATVWFGVFAIVATVSGKYDGNFDTIYVDNLVVKEDVMVEDDVMVNGNLAVNNDVIVNQGDVKVEQGDVNVDKGDLNVGGDANIGGNVNENVDTTEPPATEPPATEPPATEPPATEPPATEPPATEPPATESPATASFTLVDSGEGWWEVKFEGMNSADIVLDSADKGSIEWLSENTLKVTKTCEGTCYFSLTDNVSGEVIYLF